MTAMPKEPLSLSYYALRLADWLPKDSAQLILLSSWETCPENQIALFEMIRLGSGEARRIVETPGHLFESADKYERSISAGLMFLIMAFNWEAYIVSKGKCEYIQLGDGYVLFSGSNGNVRKAFELAKEFNLDVRS